MQQERFRRIELLIGPEGLSRLHESHVAVIGLGAVGGYTVEALARAGIGHLRLVDSDVVHSSNINRQLYALESTIGLPKVEVARERVLQINPACQVEALRVFVDAETVDEVLAGPPDLVIDAIDAVAPKVELLASLASQGIPAICAMGAAMRTDPSAIRVGSLADTKHCPLAKQVRKRLRKRGVDLGITCVYSVEPANPRYTAESPEAGEVHQLSTKPRALGSLPTMTGIFGLTCANVALQMLLGDLFPRM